MGTRKIRKHSLSDKLKAIEYYQLGYGSSTISNELDIPVCMISRWIRVHQTHGFNGFHKQRGSTISQEIKQRAVREVLEKSLSFETVALKYQVSISAVYSWTQRVKKHGYASLSTIQKGRPSKDMGRPKKKQPETDLEKLQEELRYLKAENAYLKKLRVLVEERIARESGRESKSSKH